MHTDIKLSSVDLSKVVHVLEACDGLAVIKTIDGKKGLAQLIYPPSNQNAVKELLAHLIQKEQMNIEYL